MSEFMEFYQYVFSSFWTWLGTYLFVIATIAVIVGTIKLIRG